MLFIRAKILQRIICIILTLLIVNGCSLLVRGDHARNEEQNYPFPYPGVCLDLSVIFAGNGPQGVYSPLIALLCIIDLPISFTIDTILLPKDIGYLISRSSPKDESKDEETQN